MEHMKVMDVGFLAQKVIEEEDDAGWKLNETISYRAQQHKGCHITERNFVLLL